MSIGQETYEQILNKMLLPYNHLSHLHRQDIHKGTLTLDAVIQFFNVYALHKYIF